MRRTGEGPTDIVHGVGAERFPDELSAGADPTSPLDPFPSEQSSRARRWSQAVGPRGLSLLLTLLAAASVTTLSVGGPTSGGWPTPGLAVAALVVCPRRERILVALALVGLVTAAFVVSTELTFASALLSTCGLLVPAVIGSALLAHGSRIPMGTPEAENRFATILLATAVATGLLFFCTSLPNVSPGVAWPLGVIGGFIVLSSWQVVLPVMFSPGSRLSFAGPLERVVVLTTVLAIVLAAFLPGLGLLMFFAFPALGWAALRLSRRETTALLAVVSAATYGLTLAGLGPLTGDIPGLPASLGPAVVFAFISACAYIVVPITNVVERYKESIHDERRASATIDRFLGSATRTLILTVDAEGRITSFNSGGEALLGYRAEDVVGRPASILCRADEVARQAADLGVPADFDRVIAAQVSGGTSREWRLHGSEGQQVVVQLVINPVFDPVTHELSGFFTLGDDVTDRARATEVLRVALDREQQSVQRLVQADRVKQELVSTVSHELRTPITSIQGYTEILTDGLLGELDAEQRDAIRRVRRNAERLRNLVEDLLTLSRAESGQVELELVELDLAEVAREAVDLLSSISDERRVEVRIDAPAGALVLGDRRALERVVVNLLGNAVKFTPPGGVVRVEVGRRDAREQEPRQDLQPGLDLGIDLGLGSEDSGAFGTPLGEIAEGASPAGPAVVLAVSDTGIGISEEDQRRLFSRFFRATSARENAVPGTGLGLSIVEAVVTAHGGRVDVRSVLGEGTTMTVVLPAPAPPQS